MVKKVREEVFKHHPGMEGWKKVVLVLPLVLSVSWVVYLQYFQPVYPVGELFAPIDSTPLIIALMIFTIGYLIFLLFMFSENIHDFLWRRLGH